MKLIDKKIICELNILKNRLEAGESILQCLQSMGIPLEGDARFLVRWNKLCELMIEGKILSAKAVGEFTQQIESNNKLLELVKQKTLSPRIQAYISMGVIFILILSSILFFPSTLQPSFGVLLVSLSLATASLMSMKFLLGKLQNELIFLDWIYFLKAISLSLQCGMTLPQALLENMPEAKIFQKWPQSLRAILTIQNLENYDVTAIPHEKEYLWNFAHRVWSTLCRNYQKGLPQVELLSKLNELLEEQFKNRMLVQSEKLSYLLLIPLFLLSVPAALIILFAPLFEAVAN